MASEPPPLPGAESHGPVVTKAPPADRKFPCRQCGARLDFNPTARALQCPYCGFVETIEPAGEGVKEHDLEEYLARQERETSVAGQSSEVACGACGGVVLLEDRVAVSHCPYCGRPLHNEPAAARAMIPPQYVLPFLLDQRRALAAFNAWLASLWFAPGTLRRFANLGQLQGVYVPFWTFDSMTYSFYRGQRGDNYTVTETYTAMESFTSSSGQVQSRPVTRTRQVVKTRWTFVSGEVRHFFDDVPVCATSTLPGHYTHSLTPGELREVQPYRAEFLSGFLAERYTIGLQDAFGQARTVMDGTIRSLCRADIGGDQQRLDSVRTRHVGVTFKHLLLPVWMASYRYANKPYRVLVNGRTGQVVGDRPYSWVKISALILFILALIIALLVLMNR